MRYFTKKMFESSLPINYESLIIDERANEFSEGFYNEIYNNRKKEWLEEYDYITSYEKFKKYIIEVESGTENDHSDEVLKPLYEEWKNDILKGMSLSDAFDFNQNYFINDIKDTMPSSILEQIKDIRVLALNYASENVYKSIKEIGQKNTKLFEEAYNEYSKIEEEQFKNDPIEFIKQTYSYCRIFSCKPNNNNLEIKIYNYEFKEEIIIIFENYSIILDENIEDTEWLWKEVYKIDGGYEVHILTHSEKIPRELILRCEDIIC